MKSSIFLLSLFTLLILTNCSSSNNDTPQQETSPITAETVLKTFELNTTDALEVDVTDTKAGLRNVRTSSTYMVPNDLDDKNSSWDIIQPYFKDYKGDVEIVIIDGDTGLIKKEYADNAAWHGMFNVITKEGKLYMISGKADGTIEPELNVYNPLTNELNQSVIQIPQDMDGATYNAITVATDGAVFMTGMHNVKGDDYHKPRILEIDSSTDKLIFDSGPIGIPAQPWKVTADDDYVYILTGKVPWRIIQYQRAEPHNVKVLATQDSGLNLLQTAFGVVMETGQSGGKHYFLYKDQIILADDPTSWKNTVPPWPFPDEYTDRDKWWTLNIPHDSVAQFLPNKPEIIKDNI